MKRFVAAVLLLLLYFSSWSILSWFAQITVHFFLLGFLLRPWFGLQGKNVFPESVFLSIVVTISLALLLGYLLPVADLPSRVIMLLFACMLGWIKRHELERAFPQLETEDAKYWLALALLAGAALFSIFIFNPTYGLIADGWWHCSILNTASLDTLPLSNPWYASEPLVYPYAYHLYLSYVARDAPNCLAALNIGAWMTSVVAMLAVYLLAKEMYQSSRTAFVAAASVLLLSHLGGLGFVYDLITQLPSLGIENYLAFLKSVHGPHVHYSQLYFIGASVVTPFQIATMMSMLRLAMLAVLLYFLLKRNVPALALSMATLVVTNPIIAIVSMLTTIAYLILVNRRKTTFLSLFENAKALLLIAVVVVLVTASYLMGALSKPSLIENRLIQPFSFLETLLAFLMVYSPSIFFTVQFFQQKRSDGHLLLFCFAGASFLAVLLLLYGMAYVASDIVILFAIGSAHYFVNIFDRKKFWMPLILAAILLIPTFLIIVSYAYYIIPLEPSQLEASIWLRSNTPAAAVVLPAIDFSFPQRFSSSETFEGEISSYIPTELKIHLYPAVFGERRLAFGDITHLAIYGEDFRPGLAMHQAVFVHRDAATICTLTAKGISYAYVSDEKFYFPEATPCVEEVYRNDGVRIYRLES